jgi:hypothetical protein
MPDSATSGVPNTAPDAPPAPREYTPDGAGTLEILCARSLDTLSKDPQTRLTSIAWIIARRMASVPNGAKKHEAGEIYTDLCVKATGAWDDDEEDHETRSSEGNVFWWNHWENFFERDPWAKRPKDGWHLCFVRNATRDDDEGMHGAELNFEYNDSALEKCAGRKNDSYYKNRIMEVNWCKYDCDVHVAEVQLRGFRDGFREHCYLFQYEEVQYLALNSPWHLPGCGATTPRPPIMMVRFPAPGVFEFVHTETITNQVALTVVDTARLDYKVFRYSAQAPSVNCPTMTDLVEREHHNALSAGADWEEYLKLPELLAAYKSMFEGPARDNAQPTPEGPLLRSTLRNRTRAVLLRWINGFLRRKARKQLTAAASAAGLKRKREDAAADAAPAGDDYGFAF